jgi:hypothetical protein
VFADGGKLLGGEDLGSQEEGGAEDEQPQVYIPFPSRNHEKSSE